MIRSLETRPQPLFLPEPNHGDSKAESRRGGDSISETRRIVQSNPPEDGFVIVKHPTNNASEVIVNDTRCINTQALLSARQPDFREQPGEFLAQRGLSGVSRLIVADCRGKDGIQVRSTQFKAMEHRSSV